MGLSFTAHFPSLPVTVSALLTPNFTVTLSPLEAFPQTEIFTPLCNTMLLLKKLGSVTVAFKFEKDALKNNTDRILK
jgi:hypothetical protein